MQRAGPGVINGKLSHSLNIKDSPVTVPGKVYYFFVHDSVGYPDERGYSLPGACSWMVLVDAGNRGGMFNDFYR